jgi:broad specificity phosphatase PhoE
VLKILSFSRLPNTTIEAAIMAPKTTIHMVRHAEGHHQLPENHTDTSIHDPTLTTRGIAQSKHFSEIFPYHDQTDLLCASPCRRTIQTALFVFEPETKRGLKIVALADAQEGTDAPSDTGSDIPTIRKEFGDAIMMTGT